MNILTSWNNDTGLEGWRTLGGNGGPFSKPWKLETLRLLSEVPAGRSAISSITSVQADFRARIRPPFDSPGPKNIGVKTLISLEGENGPAEDIGTNGPVEALKRSCRLACVGTQPVTGDSENPPNKSSSKISVFWLDVWLDLYDWEELRNLIPGDFRFNFGHFLGCKRKSILEYFWRMEEWFAKNVWKTYEM